MSKTIQEATKDALNQLSQEDAVAQMTALGGNTVYMPIPVEPQKERGFFGRLWANHKAEICVIGTIGAAAALGYICGAIDGKNSITQNNYLFSRKDAGGQFLMRTNKQNGKLGVGILFDNGFSTHLSMPQTFVNELAEFYAKNGGE